ncbi:MAG TPA: hypothetical protein VHZ24_08360 [Pirellulales bacterium]|nr:hypothetical protein [Pirellulales bacterium]
MTNSNGVHVVVPVGEVVSPKDADLRSASYSVTYLISGNIDAAATIPITGAVEHFANQREAALSWIVQGNIWFTKKEYEVASGAYTEALFVRPPPDKTLRARALAGRGRAQLELLKSLIPPVAPGATVDLDSAYKKALGSYDAAIGTATNKGGVLHDISTHDNTLADLQKKLKDADAGVKKNVSTPANALQEVASQFPGDLLQAIPDIDENTKATRAEVLKVVVAYHKALNAFAESAAQAGSTVTSLDGTIKSDLKAIADEQKTLSASIAAIKQPTTDLFGAAGNIQKDIDGQLARAKQKLDQNPTDADAKTQYAAIQKLNNTAKQAAASAAALSGGVDPSSTKSDVGKALSDYNTASASFNSGVASFSTSTKAYEAATKKFGPQLTSYVSGIENAAATLDGSPKATAVTISALTATFNGNVATVKLATDQWVKDYNNLQSQTEDYIKQKKALEKAVVDNSTKYETALKSDVDAYDQLKTKVNSFAGAPTGTISPNVPPGLPDTDDIVADLRQSLLYNPQVPLTHKLLGDALLATTAEDAALASYRKARLLFPSEDWKDLLDQIKLVTALRTTLATTDP